jgi:putative phage-type endonuclease
MSAVVVARTRGMSREEWLAVRRTGLGSSDMAAVAGVSPWRSAFQVWLDKTGQAGEEPESEAMRWGTLLEPVVADEFARRTGLRVRRRHAVLRSPTCPVMLANLDREAYGDGGPGVLEVKTAGGRMEEAWADGGAPDYYLVQVQHQLAVTGRRRGWLCCLLLGSRRLAIVPVERDDALIGDLERIATDFWRFVESRTPPEVDGSASTSAALARLHPRSEPGLSAVLPPEARQWLRDYRMYQQAEREAAARKDEAANRIKAALGDAEAGLLSGQVAVTWKTDAVGRFDLERFRADHPDLYDRYRGEPARRFLVKKGEW